MTTQEIITTTNTLIKIPSTVDNKPALKQALVVVADIVTKNPSLHVEWFEQNGTPSFLAYAGKTRPKRFDVLFNAHVDVVPGKLEQYRPYIQYGRLYGRGAYDMKAAAVVMTDVFEQVAAHSPLKIGLQIVADEEMGGFDGTEHQLASGVKTDFAILGEMTDLDVSNEMRGICWAEATFKGQSAHSGYAWDGQNAITHASDFARKLIDTYPLPKEKSWVTTANIGSITTDNETFNRVPDSATVKMDFRFIPEDPHFKNPKTAERFIRSLSSTIDTVNIPIFGKAVFVDPKSAYLHQFLQVAAQVTGKEPHLIRRYASGDSRHFAEYGIPSIEFGLAGGNLHGDNEYIEITSIDPMRTTLRQFLEAVASSKAKSR